MAGLLTKRRRVRGKKQGDTSFHFPAGTRLFDPDHPARRIYLLKSGRVQLSCGPKAIVEQLSPASFFGEKCFLAPYRSDQIATTLSPIVATGYRRADLLRCLQRDRRFAVRLLKNLTLRLDRCEQALRDFVTERADRRLARLLARFAPARPASGWVRLPLRATNVDLARMAGMTRWRVSHFLNHFQRLGWLSRGHQELWIRREGLKDFIESPERIR